MQPQARLNEVMVNRVHADLFESVEKSGQRISDEGCGQHDDVGGAKVEGFVARVGSGVRILPQELVDDLEPCAGASLRSP